MMNNEEINKLHEKLENDGIDKVKSDLTSKIYSNARGQKAQVELWLQKKEQDSLKLNKEREFEISNKSNQIAEKGNWIAWLALLVAVLALGVAIYK